MSKCPVAVHAHKPARFRSVGAVKPFQWACNYNNLFVQIGLLIVPGNQHGEVGNQNLSAA
jgi:hypothetical protein